MFEPLNCELISTPKEHSAGVNFTNVLRTAFALVDPESVKNTVKSSVSFYTFGINERKSCTLNVDEIDTWSLKALRTSTNNCSS